MSIHTAAFTQTNLSNISMAKKKEEQELECEIKNKIFEIGPKELFFCWAVTILVDLNVCTRSHISIPYSLCMICPSWKKLCCVALKGKEKVNQLFCKVCLVENFITNNLIFLIYLLYYFVLFI